MVERSRTVEAVLETAIRLEERSEEIYRKAAASATAPGARILLQELAEQEVGHRKLLLEVRDTGDHQRLGTTPAPDDLRLADYMADVPLMDASRTEAIIIFAMKREAQAIDLYTRMLEVYRGTSVAAVLQRLLREEQQHKARLEAEYESFYLREN